MLKSTYFYAPHSILPYTGDFDRFTQFQPALLQEILKKFKEVNLLLAFCPKKIARDSKSGFSIKSCKNWMFLQLFDVLYKTFW